MKLGVFAVLFGQQPFEQALDHIAESGLQAIEIGVGGYVGNAHCNPVEFLENEQKLEIFKKAVEQSGLEISALQLVNYDGAVSIEHEDGLMSIEEGFHKAVSFLQKILIKDKLTEMWWA